MLCFRVAAGLVALLCALLAAVPASAAPRTKAAQAFSDAALHGAVALKRQAPEIQRQIDALQPKLCGEVVRQAVKQKRGLRRALSFTMIGLFAPLIDALHVAAAQTAAELDAVPTRDPALVAGRDAWGEVTALMLRYPHPDRPCERLRDWRDSGWSRELRPPLFEEELIALDEPSDRIERRLKRAARRLRQLGVSPGAAERFTGEPWGEGLDLDLDDVFGAEEGPDSVRVGPVVAH